MSTTVELHRKDAELQAVRAELVALRARVSALAETVTPDGARYAAHLIRKRSKGDRFHPRRPETAAAMLAAAAWLDQFATTTDAES